MKGYDTSFLLHAKFLEKCNKKFAHKLFSLMKFTSKFLQNV